MRRKNHLRARDAGPSRQPQLTVVRQNSQKLTSPMMTRMRMRRTMT
jgi:hypothetical protein